MSYEILRSKWAVASAHTKHERKTSDLEEAQAADLTGGDIEYTHR